MLTLLKRIKSIHIQSQSSLYFQKILILRNTFNFGIGFEQLKSIIAKGSFKPIFVKAQYIVLAFNGKYGRFFVFRTMMKIIFGRYSKNKCNKIICNHIYLHLTKLLIILSKHLNRIFHNNTENKKIITEKKLIAYVLMAF